MQRSAFYLPLFASMIIKYTISNHISSPSSLLEIFGSAPGALFLKTNHPKKYQVSKRYKKQVFINWFMWTQFPLTIRDRVVRKNLPLLSSFLRFDRECSELGPSLITKAGSAPVLYQQYKIMTSKTFH